MDDLISRQAAIDIIEDFPHGDVWNVESMEEMVDRIKQLPSAQPYTIHSDGRLWVTVDDIDKVTAVVVDEHKSKFCKQFYEDYEDAQPKRGKWIRDGHHIRCDQCGMYMCDTDREGDRIPTEFCPHCGADMREVTI